MTGKHSGVLTRVQAVAPDTTCEHCSIHREALATKGPPLRMFWTLQWKWWTWWKPGPWTLASLLHYAVKRVATELNDELNIWIIFFTCQTICTMLFLTRQVYLGITFSHLDGLLGLQGLSTTVFRLHEQQQKRDLPVLVWFFHVQVNSVWQTVWNLM